jgi:hypothetical protein
MLPEVPCGLDEPAQRPLAAALKMHRKLSAESIMARFSIGCTKTRGRAAPALRIPLHHRFQAVLRRLLRRPADLYGCWSACRR